MLKIKKRKKKNQVKRAKESNTTKIKIEEEVMQNITDKDEPLKSLLRMFGI